MDNKTKSNFSLPDKGEIRRAFVSFKKGERVIFFAIAFFAVAFALYFLESVNRLFMAEVPTYGGSFTEGIIGTPRFVNPVLAISDADRDLSMLVYSGLLRKTADGGYIPDLAEKYEISKDGLTYTFTLRDNIYFQDGTPVTTDDVEYTVQKAVDPNIKSPRRPNWEGVSVNKADKKTISFTIKQPYAQFLENAAIGIIPKNLWKDIPNDQWSFSDFNLTGIGSGPYEIDSVSKNRAGVPISISLTSFKKFALGRPYVDGIRLNFYGNEAELLGALQTRTINNVNAIMPETAKTLEKRGVQIKKYPLPRVYGVFFNQSSASALSDISVRKALNRAVDRADIVNAVLFGYGSPLFGPIPDSSSLSIASANGEGGDKAIKEAHTILANAGWKIASSTGVMTKKISKKETDTLSFSISTANKPELKAVAEMLKEQWEKIGAKVEVKVFDPGDLSQNVIRPRKYDALLFGEVVGEDSDPYAFWHSSQRNDPGLNIAMYANSKVDKLLESARATLDSAARGRIYRQFEDLVQNDVPAVFVYSPDFIYVLSPGLKGMEIGQLTVPAERFLNVHKWYTDTDWIWRVFAKKASDDLQSTTNNN